MPRDQERKLEQLRDIQSRLRRLPDAVTSRPRHARAEPDRRLNAPQRNLIDPLRRASKGQEPRRSADLVAQFERSSSDSTVARIARPVLGLQEFEQYLDPRPGRRSASAARSVRRRRRSRWPTLPECLRERYIGKNGKWLLRVFAKECLWDYEPLEEFVRPNPHGRSRCDRQTVHDAGRTAGHEKRLPVGGPLCPHRHGAGAACSISATSSTR